MWSQGAFYHLDLTLNFFKKLNPLSPIHYRLFLLFFPPKYTWAPVYQCVDYAQIKFGVRISGLKDNFVMEFTKRDGTPREDQLSHILYHLYFLFKENLEKKIQDGKKFIYLIFHFSKFIYIFIF